MRTTPPFLVGMWRTRPTSSWRSATPAASPWPQISPVRSPRANQNPRPAVEQPRETRQSLRTRVVVAAVIKGRRDPGQRAVAARLVRAVLAVQDSASDLPETRPRVHRAHCGARVSPDLDVSSNQAKPSAPIEPFQRDLQPSCVRGGGTSSRKSQRHGTTASRVRASPPRIVCRKPSHQIVCDSDVERPVAAADDVHVP